MQRRFAALKKVIWKLIVTDDAFGQRPRVPYTFNERFRFLTSDAKLEAFNRWLGQKVNLLILEGNAIDKKWMTVYLKEARKRGATRAYDAVQNKQANKTAEWLEGSKSQFTRKVFESPEALAQIRLLATRAYEQLKGITADMSGKLNRILAEGLAAEKPPREVALRIVREIDNISIKRANVLARHEIVHAAAEGQLDGFQELGVTKLGLEVEWVTSGKPNVCQDCRDREGQVYTTRGARGLIPFHVGCCCSWAIIKSPFVRKKNTVILNQLTLHSLPPIKKTKFDTYGKYTVYKVDGEDVRDTDEKLEDFSDWGIHSQFPRWIKKNEIWVEGTLDRTEWVISVSCALRMLRAEDEGKSSSEAYDIALAWDKKERQRAGVKDQGNAKAKKPPEAAIIEEFGRIKVKPKNILIEIVNGTEVRKWSPKPDFVEGGNSAVYRWIPGRINPEIWVEKDISKNERMIIVLHEFVEWFLMSYYDMVYEHAHRIAEKVEFYWRQKKVKGDPLPKLSELNLDWAWIMAVHVGGVKKKTVTTNEEANAWNTLTSVWCKLAEDEWVKVGEYPTGGNMTWRPQCQFYLEHNRGDIQ